MSEFRRWLTQITPPPGGELRLRRALRSVSRRRSPHRIFAVAVGAAVVAMLVILAVPPTVTPEHQMQAALRTALTTAPPALVVHDGAALRVPSGDPRVRIYLVANSPPSALSVR